MLAPPEGAPRPPRVRRRIVGGEGGTIPADREEIDAPRQRALEVGARVFDVDPQVEGATVAVHRPHPRDPLLERPEVALL
jgi:hypothetical protein